MFRTLLLRAKRSLRIALREKLSLPRSPITLRPLELLPKRLRTTYNKSLSELVKRRVETFKITWRIVEKRHPRASMMMIGKSFVVSEMRLSKRLIGKTIGKFKNERARLLHGLYLQQNWHPSIHQESQTTLQNSSQLYSIFHPLRPLPVPFRALFYLKRHTWLSSQPLPGICISMKPGNFANSSLRRKPLTQLLISCNNSNSTIRSLGRFGGKLYKIGLSISRRCMRQWIWGMTIRMSSRTSLVVMRLLRKTKRPQRGQFRLKLSGSEFLERGWEELLLYIHIVSQRSSS